MATADCVLYSCCYLKHLATTGLVNCGRNVTVLTFRQSNLFESVSMMRDQ